MNQRVAYDERVPVHSGGFLVWTQPCDPQVSPKGTSRVFPSCDDKRQGECDGQKINHGGGDGRGAHFATQCFCSGQRGHRQYIDRHRSAGRACGTWDTKQGMDPAARGSNESCYNRKLPKDSATAKKCDSECSGLPEVAARRNVGTFVRALGPYCINAIASKLEHNTTRQAATSSRKPSDTKSSSPMVHLPLVMLRPNLLKISESAFVAVLGASGRREVRVPVHAGGVFLP